MGRQVFIALDPAASEFYNAEKKRYSVNGKEIDSAALVEMYTKWVEKIPDLLDRGRPCQGRLGRLEASPSGWRPDPVGRRQRVRHQHQAAKHGIDEGVANSILIDSTRSSPSSAAEYMQTTIPRTEVLDVVRLLGRDMLVVPRLRRKKLRPGAPPLGQILPLEVSHAPNVKDPSIA